MLERCPTSCKKPKKKKKKKADQPAAAAAASAEPPPPPTGPADKNPNCGSWAASGECENNPDYMMAECHASCTGGGAEAEARDIHQDCAAWVQDGECYRNPAFMLQQCRASCAKFAADNDAILQDTSDTCVNFALKGGCASDPEKANRQCRASCHIQHVCANHTEMVTCSKALRCEPIGDLKPDCEARARAGKCGTEPMRMLKECLKSCSELDLIGTMRFHLPHERTRLSTLIDLPGPQRRLAGFYQTPPSARNTDLAALAMCDPHDGGGAEEEKSEAYYRSRRGEKPSLERRMKEYRDRARWQQPWSRYHWDRWDFTPNRERTPRVPHRFSRVPEHEGSSRMVTVQHISFSPRIRYLHQLLSPEECDHVLKVANPLFSRSPVRGSVTRVRTSTTAMLGGRHDDAIVRRIRQRIARFSGYPEDLIEPLQVRGQRGRSRYMTPLSPPSCKPLGHPPPSPCALLLARNVAGRPVRARPKIRGAPRLFRRVRC